MVLQKEPWRASPASTPLAGASFALLPDMRVDRELRGQAMIYTFHHTHLGQLGRIVAQQIAPGQTQLSAELSGDPADPMTVEQRRVFEPIAAGIFRRRDLRRLRASAAGPAAVRRWATAEPCCAT